MNFYKRYMGDFARDTAHLTMLQRGAYNDLLDYYYSSGRPLPSDRPSLYRIARAMTAAEKKAVDQVSDEFFPVNGDGTRHNKRADEEIAKHEAQASINRELGRKGGRPRKTERITESVSESETESVLIPEPNREPNRNPNHSQIPENPKTPLPPSGAFARFWAAWPPGKRKQAQGKCWDVWRKGGFDAVADAIIAHVEALKSSDDWRRGYVEAPMVYLNQRRWEGAELVSSEPEKRFVI